MQTSYSDTMTRGFPGMLADAADNTVESKYSAYNNGTEIAFGAGVIRAANSPTDAAVLPSANTDEIQGICLHSHAYIRDTTVAGLGTTGVKGGTTFNMLRKGRVLVLLDEAVSEGQRAYWHLTNKKWRISADGANTVDCTKQAVFRENGSEGGVAVLEVDFTNAK